MEKAVRNFPTLGRIAAGILLAAGTAFGGTIFDNLSEGWPSAAAMPSARYAIGYGLWSNSLYVVGGYGSQESNDVFRYDGGTSWVTCASFPYKRSIPGVFTLGSYLFAAGGSSNGAAQGTVHRYDGSSWTTVNSLPAARHAFGCALLNGKAYVIGGSDDSGTMQDTVYAFDGTSWTTSTSLPATRYCCFAATLGNTLYLMGGLLSGGVQTSTILKFDGTSWTSAGSLPAWRYHPAVCVQSNRILVIGGMNSSYTSVTNIYAFDGTNWTEQMGLSSAVYDEGAGVVSNQLFVVGGYPLSAEARYYRRGSTGVTPTSGSSTGGYPVAIMGTGLGNGTDVTNVTLCGVKASSINSQSATQVVITAGASGAPLYGDVRVWSTSQGETVKSNYFQYNYIGPLFAIYTDSTNWTYNIPNGAAPTSTYKTAFGVVALGQTYTSELVVSEDSGSYPLNIGTVQLVGAGAAAFTISDMPSSLESYGFSNFLVRFTPPAVGVYTASVLIASDGYPNPFILNLSGSVESADPGLTIRGTNGAAIASGEAASAVKGNDFGYAVIGSPVVRTFGITNDGVSVLTISGEATNGAGAGAFAVSGLPATVDVGGAANFTVTFTPGAAGSFSASLAITNNSPTTPYVLNLSGSGYQLSTTVGPYAGGNTTTITNGNFGTITNVLVGGASVTPSASGANWFSITMPEALTEGPVDIVVQTSDHGEITLAGAYTYNPKGAIGGLGAWRWESVGQSVVPGQVSAVGANNTIYGMHYFSNALYAGGSFTNIGGSNCARVARYDGTNWNAMGVGVQKVANVNCIRGSPHGILTGGYFTNIGGSNMLAVGRWDHTKWNAMGRTPTMGFAERIGLGFSPSVNGYVNWVEPYTGNTAIAVGYFTNSDYATPGLYYVAMYDGANWTNMGQGFRNVPLCAAHGAGSTAYVGGSFTNHYPTNTSLHMNYIAEWTGTTWTNLARGLGNRVTCMAVHPGNGDLYVGGWFTNYTDDAGNKYEARYVAKWNPTTRSFTNVGAGFNNWVYSLAFDSQSNLIACGSFTNTLLDSYWNPGAEQRALKRIARWDGTYWTNMGSGFSDTVLALTADPDRGTVYAGGFFRIAYQDDGTSTDTWYVAKWDRGGPSAGVAPSSGSVTGGYTVAIVGENIGGGDITNVTLCGVQSTILSQGVDQVWVRAGTAGSAGSGDVVIRSTSYGTTVGTNAFTYTASGILVSGPAFAPVAVGGAATNIFTVTNNGNEVLTIAAVTNHGTGEVFFNALAIPGKVEAGTASNFPVVFTAGAAGTFNPVCYTVNDSPVPNYSFGLSGSAFILSTNVGPYAGGNTITITNGNFGTITNVLVGGVPATIVDSGANWVTITMPATGSAGVKDIVIQTDGGDITLANAYTVHPAGSMGGMVMDGFVWTNLAQGFGNDVNAVYVGTNGTLYAGGAFTSAVDGASTPRIAQWDGTAWTNVGTGFNNYVQEIREDSTGTLYAVGEFNGTFGADGNCRRIGRWDGGNWTNMGIGVSSRGYTVTFDTNDVPYFGGTFTMDGYGCYFGRVLKWDGGNWTNIYESDINDETNPIGFDGTVYTSVRGLDGNLYFGGSFSNAITPTGTTPMSGVAMWDGTELHPMGAGLNSNVNKLVVDSNGTLYAGGDFTASGGQSMSRVARWDGVNWTNVGGAMNGTVYSLAVDENDHLYASGDFTAPGYRLAMWDGTSWNGAAANSINGDVMALTLYSNETMLAGGTFTAAGGVATNRIGLVWPNRYYSTGTTPSSGSWTGGYTVAIVGENIGGGDITNVTLCGVQAVILSQVVDRVWVRAGTAGSAGSGDVVIRSTSYGTTIGTNAFTYTASGILVSGPAFAPTPLGGAATNIFTVTNTGNAVLTIAAVTNNGTGEVFFNALAIPGRVEAGTASNFPVVFTAGAAGTFNPVCYTVNDSPVPNYSFGLSGSAFILSTNVGPYAGGNTITIANGNFGTITNVLVGGVAATIVTAGGNWVTITLPATGSAGVKDIVIQTDGGDITLLGAYTVNPTGEIKPGSETDWTRWESAPPLPYRISSPGVGVFSNKIYCVGGTVSSVVTNLVVSFDGTNWTYEATLPTSRFSQATAVLGENFYAIGGGLTSGNHSNVYRYDGTAWTEVQGQVQGRVDIVAPVMGGAIYSVGGSISGNARTNVYRYNGTNWTEVAGLPFAECRMAGGWVGADYYVVGGYSSILSAALTNVYRYDGSTFTSVAGLPTGTQRAVAATLDRFLYVFGGSVGGSAVTNMYRFDGTNWTQAAGLPEARSTHGGATFQSKIYCVGGNGSSNVYRYPARTAYPAVSPASGLWAGGFEVVISGTNLGNGADITNVTLCGVSATISSQIAERVWIRAGAATAAGGGDVCVYSVSFGETVKSNAFTYTGAGILFSGPSFGPVPVGVIVTNIFTVTNSGNAVLDITDWTNNGSGSAYFDMLMPEFVEPGTASNFPVVFSPTAAGTFNPTCYTVNDSPIPNYSFGLYGSAFMLSTNVGPYAGGNTITIANGNFGTITNVLVGGVPATILDSGASWVTITMPAAGSAGVKDIVIQTDSGDVTLANAYTVNPAGVIGGEADWSQWVEVAGLAATRFDMGAGVLSNRIYGVGGADQNGVGQTNVYCYDGTSWTEMPGLPAARFQAVAGEVNGSLIVAGGSPDGSSSRTNVFRFTGTGWEEVAGMPNTFWDMAGATYAGAFYVIGGGYYGPKTNVYRFDGTSWTEVAGLPAPRDGMGAAACGGYLYAVAGVDSTYGGNYSTNVYRYDGTNWTEVAGLPAPRGTPGVAARDGALFVVGGQTEEETEWGWDIIQHTNVYRYDGSGWTEMVGLPREWGNVLLANPDNALYAFGGSPMATNVYRYPAANGSSGVEPASGSWTGGYAVVIVGTNLCNGGDVTSATLCGVPAAVVSQSPTQVVVTAGTAGAAGSGDVRVYSTSFGETVKSNAFAYVRAEQVALTFTPASPQVFRTTNTLSVSGGSGTGAVSYTVLSGPGAIVGANGLTVTGGSGTITVVATKAQDDLYFAVSATATVAAAKADQTIDFPNPGAQVITNVVALTATATSGLNVNYGISGPVSVDAGPPVVLSFTGTGTVRVVASEPGDVNWNAAPTVTNTFNVTKATAGVTLNSLSQTYDGTARVVTSQTSPTGLAVIVTYDGHTWAPTNAGTYAVTGTINDATYQGSAAGNLVVSKGTQSGLAFAPASPQAYNTTNGLSASGGQSTGGWTYTVESGTASIVDGTNLWMQTGVDSVLTRATKAGDNNWNEAYVEATVNAAKAEQAISFTPIANQVATNTVGLAATAGSGLEVAFSVLSGPASITEGTNLSFTGEGLVSIVASQTGDVNWAVAPAVTNTFTVAKVAVTVTLSNLDQSYDGTAKAATATSEPDGPSIVLTYDGNAWAPTNVGTYTVVAAVDEPLYSGGATGTLTVTKGNQTIAWAPIGNQRPTNVVHLAATASSGLEVLFAVVSGPAAITNGTNLSFSGSGAVTVRASQAGDASWNPAATSQTFRVASTGVLDFDGDGVTDVGVFRGSDNTWHAFRSTKGELVPFPFGIAGDIHIPADYDGDGFCDVAVFRPSTATWFIFGTATGPWTPVAYGLSSDRPIPADYDGDGKADLAVLRPTNMTWYIFGSTEGAMTPFAYGVPGDQPVPADYDGDGLADPAVVRPTTMTWYAFGTSVGEITPIVFGVPGDIPVPGDYDGDGRIDYGVFRPSDATWYIFGSSVGPIDPFTYGTIGDVPLIFPW